MGAAALWVSGVVAGAVIQQLLVAVLGDRVDRGILALFRRREKDLSINGTWKSAYTHPSYDTEQCEIVQHVLVVTKVGRRIRMKSTNGNQPARARSFLTVKCILDDKGILTGTWTEQFADGRRYHGVVQLRVSPTGENIAGMWTGYSRMSEIQAGEWTLRRERTAAS